MTPTQSMGILPTDPKSTTLLWEAVQKFNSGSPSILDRRYNMSNAASNARTILEKHGVQIGSLPMVSRKLELAPLDHVPPSPLRITADLGNIRRSLAFLQQTAAPVKEIELFAMTTLFRQQDIGADAVNGPLRLVGERTAPSKRPSSGPLAASTRLLWLAPEPVNPGNGDNASQSKSKSKVSKHPGSRGTEEPTPFWNANPQCIYVLDDSMFQSAFRSQVNILPLFRQRGMYPYLTVEVVDFQVSGLSLDEVIQKRPSPFKFGVQAVYNRWMLWDSVNASEEPENAAGACGDETNLPDADCFADRFRHFLFLVSLKDWCLVQIKPKADIKGPWAGVRMSQCTSNNFGYGLDDFVQAVHQVHLWGAGAYQDACKDDIKAFYNRLGGDSDKVSPRTGEKVKREID